jgi:hypothetical protein
LAPAGPDTFTQYVVQSVVDDNELILVSGPSAPVTTPQAFQLWKADTSASQIQYVSSIAESYSNRRVAAVWCDSPTILTTTNGLQAVDLNFICAEIAGLRSALYPQQGLTNTQILSASQAPLMYTKYSEAELNTAASNGVWIIGQDYPGAVLYIRQQLTSDVADGLLAWEDSCGTNIDALSYDLAAINDGVIGHQNATNNTVDALETQIAAYLNNKQITPNGMETVGPQIITWNNLSVGLDPNFADRIVEGMVLTIPAPVNVITINLNATTATPATVSTVTASSTLANG